MSKNKFIKIRSTKEGIGFSCLQAELIRRISVDIDSSAIIQLARKHKNISIDKESSCLIIQSDTAGIMIANNGDFLIKAINEKYYPTTAKHIRVAIKRALDAIE